MVPRRLALALIVILLFPAVAAALPVTFDGVSASVSATARNTAGTPIDPGFDSGSDLAGFSISADSNTNASDADADLVQGALTTNGYVLTASTSGLVLDANSTIDALANASSTVALTVHETASLLFEFEYEAERLRPGTDRQILQNMLRLETSASLTPVFDLLFDDVSGSETFQIELEPGQYEIHASSLSNAFGRAVGIADDAGSGRSSLSLSVQVVPEPATGLLLLLGLAGFSSRRLLADGGSSAEHEIELGGHGARPPCRPPHLRRR